METKLKNWTTQYNESEFIESEIDFFKNNKQEFLVSILWDEEREVESVNDKEIEDHVEDTCCAVTMDPLDVKDLIIKLRKLINEYSKENNTK